MKSFFQPESQAELLARLEKLKPDTAPQWGEMNAAQMLAHCAVGLKTPTGGIILKKTPFWMRIIGGMIKQTVLGEKPYKKSSPTATEFRMTGKELDFEKEKQDFLESFRILAVGSSAVKVFDHAFFGSMTADEWGRHLYKHTDYHFSQFGI